MKRALFPALSHHFEYMLMSIITTDTPLLFTIPLLSLQHSSPCLQLAQLHLSTQSLLQAPALVALLRPVTVNALLDPLYMTLLPATATPFSDTLVTVSCTPRTVTLASGLVSMYKPRAEAYKALFEAVN